MHLLFESPAGYALFQVLKSGVEGFDKMLEVERSGNRPRSWEEDERQKKKE